MRCPSSRNQDLVIFRRFLNFGPIFVPFLGTTVKNAKHKKGAPGNSLKNRASIIKSLKCVFCKMYIFGVPIESEGPGMVRDGKSLQNSTQKTLSLKNQHTKYVQKMLKIVHNEQKCPKLHTEGKKTFMKCMKKPKNSTAIKNQHMRCGHLLPSLGMVSS